MLPLFLLVVFIAIQLGQLSIALTIVNYSAGSIGRRIAQADPPFAADGNLHGINLTPDETTPLTNNMTVGMYESNQESGVRACAQTDQPGAVTAEVTVWTSAKIGTFPFVGQLLNTFISVNSSPASTLCADNSTNLGPFNFSRDTGGPYYIQVNGKAITRMNYQPNATS